MFERTSSQILRSKLNRSQLRPQEERNKMILGKLDVKQREDRKLSRS